MRWRGPPSRSGGPGYRGVGEDGVLEAIARATGLDLARALREWTEGTRDPDFVALLQTVGIRLQRKHALESPHFALLGLKLQGGSADSRIAQVFDGGPAQQAGLSAGDVLVAVDGLRAAPARVDALLARYAPGDTVEVLAFRREELQRVQLSLSRQPPPKFVLEIDDKASTAAKRQRAAWCGERRS